MYDTACKTTAQQECNRIISVIRELAKDGYACYDREEDDDAPDLTHGVALRLIALLKDAGFPVSYTTKDDKGHSKGTSMAEYLSESNYGTVHMCIAWDGERFEKPYVKERY